MRSPLTPPHTITLVILTGVSVMTLNMILPSLAQMAEEFDVPYAYVNIAISGYLAITAVLQIIIGPLSDMYGRRRSFWVRLLFLPSRRSAAYWHRISGCF